MKSNRQSKRKIIEVSKQQNESRGGSAKKSATGTGRGNKKSESESTLPDNNSGVLSSSSAPLSAQEIPSSIISCTESVRNTLSEFQIHQQNLSAKIKLQLFPINKNIQVELEKDGYNPFLELTLSVGKKISSVIKHLSSKWGSSRIMHDQLMLFPYNTKSENVASCKRWTSNDRIITAGEVYVAVESPSIFRLRYGWFSNVQMEPFGIPPKSSMNEVHIESQNNKSSCCGALEIANDQEGIAKLTIEGIRVPPNINKVVDSDVNKLKSSVTPVDHVNDEGTETAHVGPIQSTVHWDDNWSNLSIGGLLSEISLQGKANDWDLKSVNRSGMQRIGLISDISIGGLLSEASLQGKISNPDAKLDGQSSLQPIVSASNDISIGGLMSEVSLLSNKSKSGAHQDMEKDREQLQSPWDDSLTTLSIGGLLSEASLQEKVNVSNLGLTGRKSSISGTLPDSFDAFIAAQLNKHPQALKSASHVSHSSILDAEETCHSFPVRKFSSSNENALTSNGGAGSQGFSNDTSSKPLRFPNDAQTNNPSVFVKDSSSQQPKTKLLSCSRGVFDEESSIGLSGIKWNDSLEPFDLGLPSRKVTSGDY